MAPRTKHVLPRTTVMCCSTPAHGQQKDGAGEVQYLRGDLCEWLQRHQWHLDGRRLRRGHLRGRSQVWRQVNGHWLKRAHGLWGQDLWQGCCLGQRRLEEEGRLLHSIPLRCHRCSDMTEIISECAHTYAYPHTYLHTQQGAQDMKIWANCCV